MWHYVTDRLFVQYRTCGCDSEADSFSASFIDLSQPQAWLPPAKLVTPATPLPSFCKPFVASKAGATGLLGQLPLGKLACNTPWHAQCANKNRPTCFMEVLTRNPEQMCQSSSLTCCTRPCLPHAYLNTCANSPRGIGCSVRCSLLFSCAATLF